MIILLLSYLIPDEDSESSTPSRVLWLKNKKEPRKQVHEFLQKTVHVRAAFIRDQTLPEIIAEYPRLLDTEGMVSTVDGDCIHNYSSYGHCDLIKR